LDIFAAPIEVSAAYDNNRNEIESLLVEAAKNTDGIIIQLHLSF
jgi:hypothetical protein